MSWRLKDPLELLPPCRDKLDALTADADGAIDDSICKVKECFRRRDMANGLLNLFAAFESSGFLPILQYEKLDKTQPQKWGIYFHERPYSNMYLAPNCSDPSNSIDIYYYEKRVRTMTIMGFLEKWEELAIFCWNYGRNQHRQLLRLRNTQNQEQPLPPLWCNTFGALYSPETEWDDFYIRETKQLLGQRDLGRGLLSLFMNFEAFVPQIRTAAAEPKQWEIYFDNSPFRSLHLFQNPEDSSSVDVFAFYTRMKTLKILDKEFNWQTLVQHCWDYGKKRQEAKERQRVQDSLPYKVQPLPPLEKSKFAALAAENDDTDCGCISKGKKALAQGDICEGIANIFMTFTGFSPRIKLGEREKGLWRISFRNPLFSELHVQPASDHAIDVVVSGRRIQSFEVYKSPYSTQMILQWLWDFAKKRQIDSKRQGSNERTRASRGKTKKPSLHRQVLHFANPNISQGLRLSSGDRPTYKKNSGDAERHVDGTSLP